LSGKWSTLTAKQDAYQTANSRYWQGLWSHTVHIDQTDALDQDAPADSLANSPTDQAESWSDEFGTAFDGDLPCRIKIDTYDGPSGQGWFATVQVRYMGTIYQRSKGAGPVDHDAAWHVYTPV
jgi:hypothetical protein